MSDDTRNLLDKAERLIGEATDEAKQLIKRCLATEARVEELERSPPADTVRLLPAKPQVVTLCGSTRFMEAFFDEGFRLTLEGVIVLSIGVCKHAEHHGAEALGGDVCERLDELHWRKIDLSDEILVLNVGGYIGDSTRAEIEYAKRTGKPVRYLEALKGGEGD